LNEQSTIKRSNDNHRPEEKTHLVADLVMGLRFFSRLPTGDHPHERPELNRMAMALPLASLIIGLAPALVLALLCALGTPSYLAATLSVFALILATGAMAEDGLADAADGLFGGMTAERRLEILKDSRHGSYGVAALCLFILARVTALGAAGAINPLAAGGIWLASTILARSGSLLLALRLPPARPDGASAAVGRLRKVPFVVGLVFAVLLAFVLAAPFTRGIGLILSLALAGLIAWGWSHLCRALVGGQTGDLIGALQGLMEMAILTVFVTLLHRLA